MAEHLNHREDMEDHSLMPERRRRARVLTLKNLGLVTAVVVVVFIVISIRSEFRDTTTGRYGRLYGKEVAKVTPLSQQQEVVTEAPAPAVAEQNFADPTLVQSARRAAYLGTEPVQLKAETIAVTAVPAPIKVVPGQELSITGGPEGLTVATNPKQKPVLGGGFGQ